MPRLRMLIVQCLLLTIAVAVASEPDLSAVSSLKVDLRRVVELGTVEPVDGITSSGQPDRDSLRVFADAGYTAVIDLRGAEEHRGFDEPAAVQELGMEYVAFPIEGRGAINFDNARQLDDLIRSQNGPVLVHCASGNRVGALLALRASLSGADEASSLETGRAGGLTGLEETVRERFSGNAE
ncbi:MAG: sulfur transferase domain-containing protein [Woeseiaceae bacterium]